MQEPQSISDALELSLEEKGSDVPRATRNVRQIVMSIPTAVAVVSAPAGGSVGQESPLYRDPGQPVETRVEDLLSRMTIEEKIAILHGDSKFTTAGIPRLGIPRRWMSDGPHGVREDVGPDTWDPAGHTDDFSTYLPTLIGLAATWDPADAHAMGKVIGEEARKRGKDVMLGPGVNIQRTPLNGRTFEYMGEDPYLTSRLAVEYIKGLQSQNVASCVKHFAVNNQETERTSISVEVDERALREIYLPAFMAAVEEGGVYAVMGAYNQLRGQHCCQNDYLLNKILKEEWNFQGIVISDWNGTHDTDEAVFNGLDCEMGTQVNAYSNYYLANPFLRGLKNGKYPISLLDDKVRRNLRVMINTHVLDDRPEGSLNTKAHQETARKIAEGGITLLKNAGDLLPLDATRLKTLAVIGSNAVIKQAHGGESSAIKAFYEIPPLEGIIKRAGGAVNVVYSEGYRLGAREEEATALADRAIAAAGQADAVIFVGGLNHQHGFDSEGTDRPDLKMPSGQDALIERVVGANPRTAVVLISGSPVEMPWVDKVPAIVEAWYPGMEGGNAVARVLFGDVNPSGKLPCTFPKVLADSPAHALHAYPGKDGVVKYEEGLLVGYRWYDTKQIEPLFPFGHGLSYTTFDYSQLKTIAGTATKEVVTVSVDIENSGKREGAEVVQVYVQPHHAALPRPEKELKAFKKVFLKPGERQTVELSLGRDAFAYYDPAKPGWVAEKGTYTLMVGSSSRDIRLKQDFAIDTTTVEK